MYHGGCKDDKKHGKGRLLYSNDAVYEGDFLDGKKHGFGCLVFVNEDKYEGEWWFVFLSFFFVFCFEQI